MAGIEVKLVSTLIAIYNVQVAGTYQIQKKGMESSAKSNGRENPKANPVCPPKQQRFQLAEGLQTVNECTEVSMFVLVLVINQEL